MRRKTTTGVEKDSVAYFIWSKPPLVAFLYSMQVGQEIVIFGNDVSAVLNLDPKSRPVSRFPSSMLNQNVLGCFDAIVAWFAEPHLKIVGFPKTKFTEPDPFCGCGNGDWHSTKKRQCDVGSTKDHGATHRCDKPLSNAPHRANNGGQWRADDGARNRNTEEISASTTAAKLGRCVFMLI
jgi:hypothetical protein